MYSLVSQEPPVGGKENSDFVAHLKKDFVEVVGPFG